MEPSCRLLSDNDKHVSPAPYTNTCIILNKKQKYTRNCCRLTSGRHISAVCGSRITCRHISTTDSFLLLLRLPQHEHSTLAISCQHLYNAGRIYLQQLTAFDFQTLCGAVGLKFPCCNEYGQHFISTAQQILVFFCKLN